MRDRDDGFTLVELLVGISILSLMSVFVMTGVVRSFAVTTQTSERVEALTSLQIAQERMSRVIRGADPVEAASATGLTVVTYEEVTGCTPVRSNACTRRTRTVYTRAADTVTQTVTTFVPATATVPTTTATATVIDDLDPAAPTTFRYFDRLGAAWDGVSAGDIRQVQITLSHDLTDAPSLVLTTGVFVRNTRVVL